MKTTLRLHADHNKTVEDLMHMNAQLGGKNYLDLDTGDIVQLSEEAPKKKSGK